MVTTTLCNDTRRSPRCLWLGRPSFQIVGKLSLNVLEDCCRDLLRLEVEDFWRY